VKVKLHEVVATVAESEEDRCIARVNIVIINCIGE